TGAPRHVEKPASRVAESGWPQTAKRRPSVSRAPRRTSTTPVGSSVRPAYEHPRGRTNAPTRVRGAATPIPAGTITTRPNAKTSRWTPKRRPPAPQRIVQPGKPIVVAFKIDQPSGAALVDYRRGPGPHTGIHLIIVRDDLSVIIHRHPKVGPGGAIRQPIVLPRPGPYRVLVDAYP